MRGWPERNVNEAGMTWFIAGLILFCALGIAGAFTAFVVSIWRIVKP